MHSVSVVSEHAEGGVRCTVEKSAAISVGHTCRRAAAVVVVVGNLSNESSLCALCLCSAELARTLCNFIHVCNKY